MKEITTFEYRGHTFRIFHNGKYYLAIPTEYIKNGRLTRTLNGLQMNANATLSGCLNTTMACLDVDYYVEQGMDRGAAMLKATERMIKFYDTIEIK